MPHLPKIFNVNWFRTKRQRRFISPAWLRREPQSNQWILKRCFDEADARETEIGYLPKVEDINLDGIDVDPDTMAGLLSVDRDLWKQETEGIHEFYAKFGDKLPRAPGRGTASLEWSA